MRLDYKRYLKNMFYKFEKGGVKMKRLKKTRKNVRVGYAIAYSTNESCHIDNENC